MLKKTVEQYFEEARSCVGDIHKTIKKLGNILSDARKMLATEEYDEFVTRLRTDLHLTKSDIEAAMMVNAGTLDERLFFSGVALSKILTLNKTDQDRLLSGLKFPLLMPDGSVEKKSWADMTLKERDQILGPKGGGIRTVDEQRHRSAGKKSKQTTFTSASFNDEDEMLIMRDGANKGEIELSVIVHSLSTKEQLDKFKEALEAKIEEISHTV